MATARLSTFGPAEQGIRHSRLPTLTWCGLRECVDSYIAFVAVATL